MKSIKMPTSTKMRLLVMASAALLVITTAVAIFHTQSAQAQVTDKNVTNLTLHSANPGQMAVTWDQPALPPADYRINWARADETFPPYDAANGNIYTESTSHTINDLDVGAVYKVRVRARYDGQSNGPWSTTATLRYATPTLIAPQDETSRVGDAVHLTLPAAVNGTSPYSYTVGNLPQGLAFDPASRTITGTPINAETTQTAYKVTDVNRQAASATFSWTVTVLNQTPTVSAAASADTAQPNDAVTLTATAADADGEQLQYLWTVQPNIGVLSDISQATTNWTAPQTDTAQAIAFTVRVSDPSGNHAMARIYVVNAPNNEPVSTTPTAQPTAQPTQTGSGNTGGHAGETDDPPATPQPTVAPTPTQEPDDESEPDLPTENIDRLDYAVERMLGQAYQGDDTKTLEQAHPWIRESWDYVKQTGHHADTPYDFQVNFGDWTSPWVAQGCYAQADVEHLIPCETYSLNLPEFYMNDRYINGEHDHILQATIVHELAHVFTLTSTVARDSAADPRPDLKAITLLYFDDAHDCEASPPHELMADALMVAALPNKWGSYWFDCDYGYNIPTAALAAANSLTAGEYPNWFDQTYAAESGDYQLRTLWTDILESSNTLGTFHQQRIVWQMKDAFGDGYCSYENTADSAYRGASLPNPWSNHDDDAADCTATEESTTPAKPDAPTVTATGPNSITISWTPPDDGGAPITRYSVVTSKPATGGYTATDAGATTSYSISGLTADTEYSVTVYAHNSVGMSPSSDATSVTTPSS